MLGSRSESSSLERTFAFYWRARAVCPPRTARRRIGEGRVSPTVKAGGIRGVFL